MPGARRMAVREVTAASSCVPIRVVKTNPSSIHFRLASTRVPSCVSMRRQDIDAASRQREGPTGQARLGVPGRPHGARNGHGGRHAGSASTGRPGRRPSKQSAEFLGTGAGQERNDGVGPHLGAFDGIENRRRLRQRQRLGLSALPPLGSVASSATFRSTLSCAMARLIDRCRPGQGCQPVTTWAIGRLTYDS